MSRRASRRALGQYGDVRDFLSVIFKHKRTILLVFLTIVLAVAIASFVMPPTFEAESTLLVKMGREYINKPETGDTRAVVNQEELINSETRILTSRDLLENVIKSLSVQLIYPDLAKNPPYGMTPAGAALLEFTKKLKVEGVKKSNVIEITFEHEDPKVAAKVVKKLVELYMEKHLQVFSSPQLNFLDVQADEQFKKLQDAENDLERFKQKHGVYSLEEQRSLLLRQRSDLDAALKSCQNRIVELQRSHGSLQREAGELRGNGALYTQTERDKIIVDARTKLLQLELQEQGLLRKYNEDNRLVVGVRNEIALVKDFLKKQEEEINRTVRTGNPVYQEVEKDKIKAEAELGAQTGKAKQLRQQLTDVDRVLRDLDMQEKEFQGLKRTIATSERNYKAYSEKLEEARLSREMDREKIANISVINPALEPVKPVRPKKALNIFLAVILGAMLSVGVAFAIEHASQRLSTPQGVESKLGLPVLATIPEKEVRD